MDTTSPKRFRGTFGVVEICGDVAQKLIASEGNHQVDYSAIREMMSYARLESFRGSRCLPKRHDEPVIDMSGNSYLFIKASATSLSHLMRSRRTNMIRPDYLLWSLLCAVDSLNQCGLMHRDIKPCNIFVDALEDKFPKIVLGDLGGCRFFSLKEGRDKTLSTKRKRDENDEDEEEKIDLMCYKMCPTVFPSVSLPYSLETCTPPYAPPEEKTRNYSKTFDVFSVAQVVLHYVLRPDAVSYDAFSNIGVVTPTVTSEYKQEFWKLLERMLSKNPSDRPSAKKALIELELQLPKHVEYYNRLYPKLPSYYGKLKLPNWSTVSFYLKAKVPQLHKNFWPGFVTQLNAIGLSPLVGYLFTNVLYNWVRRVSSASAYFNMNRCLNVLPVIARWASCIAGEVSKSRECHKQTWILTTDLSGCKDLCRDLFYEAHCEASSFVADWPVHSSIPECVSFKRLGDCMWM